MGGMFKLGKKEKFILELLLAFIFFFAFFGIMQFSTPNLVGTDGYYHIKYAYILRTEGFSREFPWWQFSVFKDGFADEYLFYHILLIPFTFLELIFAAKLSAVFFATLMTTVFYFVLKKGDVRYTWFWTLMLPLASSKFLYRVNFPRAITLSISLLLLYYYFVRNKNYIAQAIICFIFVWSFPGFYFILLILGAHIFGNLTKKVVDFKAIVYTFFGLIAGFVINPFFPNNIRVLYAHSFHMIYSVFVDVGLSIGTEMKPPILIELIKSSFLVFILFIMGFILYFLTKNKDKFEFVTNLIVAVAFLGLGFVMIRAVDYFVPFVLLFSAIVLSKYLIEKKIEIDINFSKKDKIFLSVIFVLMLFVFLFMGNMNRLRFDESQHYEQIIKFSEGDFKLGSWLSMLPGYHLFFSFIVWVTDESSRMFVRGVSLLFSIVSLVVFFIISNKFDKKYSKISTVQYLFLPMVFPFMFLIYTDIFSNLFLLLTLYLILRKRYVFAGFVGFISLLIRQNNMVWLVFIMAIIYYENFGFRFSLDKIKKYARRAWTFIASFIAFLAFVLVNKGVAIGDIEKHPAFSLHVANIVFFLLLFFLLFLPINIYNFKKIVQLIKRHEIILLFLTVIMPFFLLFFVNDHPYNQMNGGSVFLVRNILLNFFMSSMLLKAILFLVVGYAILSILVTKFYKNQFYFLYFFGFSLLAFTWLVEPRYYIPFFTFFVLFRQKEHKSLEYIQITLLFLLSSFFMYLTIYTKYFF